jgi:hypothetical protein
VKPEKIFIFTGPSISPELAHEHLQAVYLPPARLGDVYRICKLFEPRIIGIIDGYFNQVPAVWHKEILWAMSRGIRLYGAASMGALRASELDRWGMRGCGKIYQAYKKAILPLPYNDISGDEIFEDDDEVAIIHGPAELGYLAASDAMVNIRFTLSSATQQGLIDEVTCAQLIRLSKDLFYAERNYATVLETARQQGVSDSLIDALGNWIKHHAIDQKQVDAIELLKCIHSSLSDEPDRYSPACSDFTYTSQWHAAKVEIDQSHHLSHLALNELRLQGPAYFKTLDQALDSSCASSSPVQDETVPLEYSAQEITALHRTPDELNKLLSTFWKTRYAQASGEVFTPMQAEHILIQHLQATHEIEDFQARADDKQRKLATLEKQADSHALDELEKLQLCDWYFSTRLKIDMPDDIDEFAINLALADSNAFYDMIFAEYLYLNSKN